MWVHDIMREVARENQLVFEQDVKAQEAGDVDRINGYYDSHPNMTWYAVIWCTTEWEVIPDKLSIPCRFDNSTGKESMFYTIMKNGTLTDNAWIKLPVDPFPTDKNVLAIKQSIDNGIMAYYSKERKLSTIPRIESTF